jgi:hypothetical protein
MRHGCGSARLGSSAVGVIVAVALLAGCAGGGHRATSTTTPEEKTSSFEPLLPPNPYLGPAGTATSHGDSGSSDATPLAGPGTGPVDVTTIDLGAVCPSILVGNDGYPVALCTRVADVRPVVLLLDPATGEQLASLEPAPGGLFGGVYGYLDDADRMVVVDGNDDLLRIGHRRDGDGWALYVDERVPLAGAVPAGDEVTSVTPGYDGEVWFATAGGTVGVVGPDDGSVSTTSLPAGERIANNISSAPSGTAVASDHAVYLFSRDRDGRPVQRWRHAYDRGPARKPGQLSWGTGSTPTFFGPTDGADYVAVVDNADPEVHLVVFGVEGDRAGKRICAPVVLQKGGPGSENSPIGAGRTVVVASTYGYTYPRLPADAGPSRPASARFEGGMTRVDVRADGSGCDVVWDSDVASVAVPKLSTSDGTILTVTRPPDADGAASAAGPFAYASTVISAEDGRVLASRELPAGTPDPLQLAGTVGPHHVLYQGTLGAILRITAR